MNWTDDYMLDFVPLPHRYEFSLISGLVGSVSRQILKVHSVLIHQNGYMLMSFIEGFFVGSDLVRKPHLSVPVLT